MPVIDACPLTEKALGDTLAVRQRDSLAEYAERPEVAVDRFSLDGFSPRTSPASTPGSSPSLLREGASVRSAKCSIHDDPGTKNPNARPEPQLESNQSGTAPKPKRSFKLHKDLSLVHKASSSAHLEPVPLQHSGLSGIMDEMFFVSTKAQSWRGTIEAASSVNTEQHKRDRQAEELMNHLLRHKKRALSQDEAKQREAVLQRREKILLGSGPKIQPSQRESAELI